MQKIEKEKKRRCKKMKERKDEGKTWEIKDEGKDENKKKITVKYEEMEYAKDEPEEGEEKS